MAAGRDSGCEVARAVSAGVGTPRSLPSLTLADVEDHAFFVDVLDPQVTEFVASR